MNFSEFSLLTEGGNVSFGKTKASQLDLTVIDRDILVPVLKDLLAAVAKKFKQLEDQELWSSETFKSNKFLSGSGQQLFNTTEIPSREFKRYKQFVGDLDLKIDRNYSTQLKDFLSKVKGKKITVNDTSLTLIDFKESSFQCITLWKLKFNTYQVNIQIDWQLVEFDDLNSPLPFSDFYHSSHWADITKKIKGVFHKFLLKAITRSITKLVRVKTRDTVTEPTEEKTHSLSYKGLRPTFEVIGIDKNKYPIVKKLTSKTATYEKSIPLIFNILFPKHKTEVTKQELQQLESFTGLLELINSYINSQQQTTLAKKFIDLVYDIDSYPLYSTNFEKDRDDKQIAVDYLLTNLTKLSTSTVKSYYKEKQSLYETKFYPTLINRQSNQ